ncbi:hypothetical protein HELRODRAFT_190570, partial [Helobdella robusta]|uniref:DUF4203 domain-containing protein n=1 Tax=Helobdella robusta TaxID=6412 RepID=T1FS37_HELRO
MKSLSRWFAASLIAILTFFSAIEVSSSESLDFIYTSALSKGTVSTKTLSKSNSTIQYGDSTGRDLKIICYTTNERATFSKLWMSTCFHIESEGVFNAYYGRNASTTYQAFTNPSFSILRYLIGNFHSYCFRSFEDTCLGLETNSPISVTLVIEDVSNRLLIIFSVAATVFILAECLSKSAIFQYLIGTMVGVIFFTFVICALLARAFPNRLPMVTVFLIAFTGTTTYMMSLFYNNLYHIIDTYFLEILVYLTLTGMISFSGAYLYGPIRNPRAQRLLQWFLQIVALVVLYNTMSCSYLALAVCATVCALTFFCGQMLTTPSAAAAAAVAVDGDGGSCRHHSNSSND